MREMRCSELFRLFVVFISVRRWKRLVPAFLTCLLLAGALLPAAHAEEVVEVVTFEYPPMMTAALPKDGLLGEIVHAAFEAAGQESKISYTSPKRILMLHVGQQESGAFLSPINLVKRQKADDKVICMNPLVNILMVFYYYTPAHDAQEFDSKTLEELAPYRVGAITGSNTIPLLTSAGLSVVESSVEKQIPLLQKGRIDLAIVGLLTGKALVEEHFPESVADFAFIEKPLMELPTGICFNKQHPSGEAWAESFVEGFRTILQQGTYREILERYYGKDRIPPQYDPLFEALEKTIILDLGQVPEL